MGAQERRFFNNNEIDINSIMYITRDGRKSVIHLEDGNNISTFHTIKGLLENLPEERFECINKGIVVSARFIDHIEDNRYYMTDETVFKGRVHSVKATKDKLVKSSELSKKEDWEQYNILDEMPLPFCIIELVFDESGRGIDFIFRYCNKEMESLEGKKIEEMIDKSFYEVFENGDKKWLVVYADVAINGVKRVIESYSPEIDANLRIYCYQPKPNFCACLLNTV